MLGKRIIFLTSIIVISSLVPSVSAQENSELIILEIDKEEYHSGDSLTILGMVLEKKMPTIAMRIYDPESEILSANNIEIKEDDSFSKTIFLDGPFYEQTGEYKISFDYGKERSQLYFKISNGNYQEPKIVEEEEEVPELVMLSTNNAQYANEDFVTIHGSVSQKTAPTVLVGLYDPFGFPAGFYFGNIDSDLEFTVSFMIKDGVNFKTFGTHSVIAYYEESEMSVDFDYAEIQLIEEPVIEEPVIEEPVIEEPVIEEPVIEEPVIEEPVIEEPVIEEPVIEEPVIEEPVIEEPVIEEPVIEKTFVTKSDHIPTPKQTSSDIVSKDDAKHFAEANNLSVKDIALGIMLNQIKLSCDDGNYVDSISYYDGMGPALMRLCNFDDAINHFDLALIDEPQNVQILTNKGSALNKLGFFDEAISFFDHALEINPNFLPAINNKANTLVNLGKIQNAIEYYNMVLSLDPDFSIAKQNLDMVQKQFPNNLQFSVYEKTNDVSLDSITRITNNVADSTINTVNQINENPSNVFEQIGVVFSMIGTSFFSFLN